MAHARLVGLVNTMSERSSGGRSRGGRYLKPDTARRHFIFHIAFENLQRGVLPTPHDFDMLFGPAPVINVPSTPEMQRWIDERSGWREKASTRELPASGEQTLLARCFSVGPRASTLARAGARPGRPPDYVFDFGNFEGVALKKMFLHKTVASKPSTNRATGEDFWQHGPDYIKWLAGDEFDWQFPKHTLMYLELKASIGRPLELSNSMWLLPDLRRAAAAFDEYMKDAFPSLGAPSPEPATPSQPILRWLRPQLTADAVVVDGRDVDAVDASRAPASREIRAIRGRRRASGPPGSATRRARGEAGTLTPRWRGSLARIRRLTPPAQLPHCVASQRTTVSTIRATTRSMADDGGS